MMLLVSVIYWISWVVAAPSEQHVLNSSPTIFQGGNPRKLQGRFLHITDVHPDPFYKVGTDPAGEHPCHAGSGDAGYFGAATTDCDTPFTLVNATFKWIEENIKDHIDFVIWTGDSARHDNDEKHPRSNKQVEDLNAFVVHKFVETFGKPDNRDDPDPTNDFVVPIVPTYGNNDILPHNIFEPGPNRWTSKYLDIWAAFVPQEQRHSFARGGWFFSEVIPSKLAVFSLNTLYFFDSNSAVDGCDADTEPGYEHFEWLRIQLQFLRERGMKAILIGHVPPARTESKQNWDETCYQKWTLWQRQYRDVIVANIFGHMNIDHFMLQDEKDLTYKFKIDGIEGGTPEELDLSNADSDIHVAAKADYLNDLRGRWAELPKPPKGFIYSDIDEDRSTTMKKRKRKGKKQLDKFLKEIGGPWAERYSMSLVSPSIVPNFFPTLRIIEYNITGLEKDHPATGLPTGKMARSEITFGPPIREEMIMKFAQEQEIDDVGINEDDILEELRRKKKHKKKKGGKPKPSFPLPKPPSKTSAPGPAYSPQTFTFLDWTQLYANLTTINEAVAKELHISTDQTGEKDIDTLIAKKMKKHFKFETEYSARNDTIYHMHDLTIRSWLQLAEKIGRPKYSTMSENENDDESVDKHFSTHIVDTDDREEDDEENEDTRAVVVELTNHERFKTQSELKDDSIGIRKKKKHKKKRKGASMKNNHVWRTFIRRVFVSSKTDEELEADFG